MLLFLQLMTVTAEDTRCDDCDCYTAIVLPPGSSAVGLAVRVAPKERALLPCLKNEDANNTLC